MLSAAALAMIAVTAALLLPLLLLVLLLLWLLLFKKTGSTGSVESFGRGGGVFTLGQDDTGALGGCGACRAADWTQEWIWSAVGL